LPKQKRNVPTPGFLTLERLRRRNAAQPTAAAPRSMPSTAQWRLSLDKAACLARLVADQMQTYSDGRLPEWYATAGAELFHECLDDLYDLEERLDDIRSNF
jgi:hypothetical protein